jgi:hypothetical protein
LFVYYFFIGVAQGKKEVEVVVEEEKTKWWLFVGGLLAV